MDPTPNGAHVRALAGHVFRRLPNFRGKARLGRLALGDNNKSPALVVDRSGNVFKLPNLQEPVAFSLWLDGSYELELLNTFRSICRAGDTFVDVGANIGVFSIPLSRHVGPTGRILSIEASDVVSSFLQDNVARNFLDNVTVCRCAAADGQSSSVEFYNAPMSNFGMGSRAPQFGASPVAVISTSLDELVVAHSCKNITAIKVDVEGFEAHVFQGSRRVLATHSPVVAFEFCDWAEERAFPGRKGWAQELLLEMGYSIWRLSDYLAGTAALTEPVRSGSDTLLAAKSVRVR